MSVDGISAALLQNTAAAPATAATTPASHTIDQKQFLQLFIAQLQHQDPLSPLQPDQLTAQLAQFASLEQLTGINTRLDTLNGASKDTTSSGLLGLIGKQVTFDGGKLLVKNAQAPAVQYAMTSAADHVTATVRAADGTAVRVVELGAQGAGQHTFQFDGRNNLGTPLADGTYELEINSTSGDAQLPTALSLVTQATVDGVDLGANPPALLINGQQVGLDQVKQVLQGSGS